MIRYWIRNADGTVLGPIGFNVVRDLAAAGQLRHVFEASTDGHAWKPVGAYPELRLLLGRAEPLPAEQAQRIREELAAARRLPLHQVFGVAESASKDEIRAAFFAKVKPYHPQRLPPTTPADVRAASAEMFKFLSDLMLGVHSGPRPRGVPSDPAPTFAPDEFIGLRRGPGNHWEADILVGARSAELFTRHRLVNASSCGFFVAGQVIPLGTPFDVKLRFEGNPRTLSTRGKVVLEVASTVDPSQRGTGIQMSLSREERSFLQSFIHAVSPVAP